MRVLFYLIALSAITLVYGQKYAQHPLDPLDSNEIKLTVAVLKKAGKIENEKTTLFGMIYLSEPEKAKVLAYKDGDSFDRIAFASVYDYPKNMLYEAYVDLNKKKLISYTHIPNKQPVGTFEMDSITTDICRADPEMLKALKKRGIHPDSVMFRGNNAADMGVGPTGHREKIISPYYKNKKYRHTPVGGLFAHVDLTNRKVLKIIDEGKGYSKPVDPGYFDEDNLDVWLEPLNPVIITQPEGTNYTLEGNQVTTPYWKFRYGIHNREGLIIYDVKYFDPFQKKWRGIMYRGSMAEMVVSYGSPDLLNATNNYFDQGEFRFFQEKNRPLNIGADAPENATYIDAVVHDDEGNPVKIDNAVAIYESYGGALWRHGKVGRRATDLAIKYYIKAGNYDYGFTWIFKEDGSIQVDNELQGIVHIRSVEREDDREFPEDENYLGSPYGVTVHPHVEANNHQHWHVWRLDMDIDGQENMVAEINNVSVPAGKSNPYRNAVVGMPTVLETEQDAMRDQYAPSSRRWKVMNPSLENKWGHKPGYVLMPKQGTVPLALEGSSLSNRAKVLWHHFWVTPYEKDEIYPAGMYPPSDQKWEGLPDWTSKNRDIKNKDVVLWYVMGKSHVVRAEDWPIMNQASMSFKLVPFGFFDSNPVYGKPPVNQKILGSNELLPTSTKLAEAE